MRKPRRTTASGFPERSAINEYGRAAKHQLTPKYKPSHARMFHATKPAILTSDRGMACSPSALLGIRLSGRQRTAVHSTGRGVGLSDERHPCDFLSDQFGAVRYGERAELKLDMEGV